MSFTGIEVVLSSSVLFLASLGKDMSAFMNEEMMSCSDEDVAAELHTVTTVVMDGLARDGIVGSDISITSTPCKDEDGYRRLM